MASLVKELSGPGSFCCMWDNRGRVWCHPLCSSAHSSLLSQTGTYCCGPVSVRAIKEGDLSTKYDAPFVFAEVNADVVDWIRQEDGSVHKSINRSLIVGQKISTKSVGRDEREDITHTYKYPEGRHPHPRAFNLALQMSSSFARQPCVSHLATYVCQ